MYHKPLMMHEFRRIVIEAAVSAAMSSRSCVPAKKRRKTLEANGADGISDVEGKATRVGASELGSERVSMELMGSAT
jgi:hypothetical protein